MSTIAASSISIEHTRPGPSLGTRIKAIKIAFLAAALHTMQEKIIYKPWREGVEKMKSPGDYFHLKNHLVDEQQLLAADGVPIVIWRKEGTPHYLCFHGNRGHWGDVGSRKNPQDMSGPMDRLVFLKTLADSGAGFTAVTLRGFGKSGGRPGEKGFEKDIDAIVNYLIGQNIAPGRLNICGESLGTWAATKTAVVLAERGHPAAMLSLQNPFSSMAQLAEEHIRTLQMAKLLGVSLPMKTIDRYVLRHPHRTEELLSRLGPETYIQMSISGNDTLINRRHSERLREVAERKGLAVSLDLFPDAGHAGIPPVKLAESILHHTDNMRARRGIKGDSAPPCPVMTLT